MKRLLWFIPALVLVAVGTFFVSNSRAATPTAAYKVLQTDGAFEIREYETLHLAKVTLPASDKRSKTVTVLVERRTAHELYGKIVAKSSKYHAHDEKGEYKMGDLVEIAEGRPISKTKSWTVTRLVEKAKLI